MLVMLNGQVRLIVVSQTPSGILDPAQGWRRRNRCESLVEKRSPVVRRDGGQRAHQIVERVRPHLRMSTAAAEERATEIVQRALAGCERANGHVDIEPEQRALGVEIDAAPL